MKPLRHIAVGLVALALAFGTGWQSCATLQQPSSTVAAMPDEMASHHAMGHHDHMASAGQDAAQADTSNDVQSNADSHACLKCCAACMMGNAASVNPEWTVARAMSRVLFPPPDEQLRGHIVFVDPDIPKPVA